MRKLLNKLLEKTNYRIVKTDAEIKTHELQITREYIFAHRLMRSKEFFFIQIGANDGVMCDDIYDFVTENKLSGIVVEPLPDIFKRLRANYKDYPNIVAVNKAIYPSGKTVKLYRVKPEHDLKEDYDGIASLFKEHHLKSKKKIPDIDAYIVEEEVPCISFHDLIETCHVNKIDLLQIDTEGYDYEIIKMINFQEIKPHIIRYEYKHLSGVDRTACIGLLKKQGYQFFMDSGKDMIAYLAPDRKLLLNHEIHETH